MKKIVEKKKNNNKQTTKPYTPQLTSVYHIKIKF